jgi:hypothetical protein
MTEAEWLACADPGEMPCFLEQKLKTPPNRKWPKLTERKQRLFACACCRRIWHRLVDERSRRVVEVAERCADGSVTDEELLAAAADAYAAATDDRSYDNDDVGAPEYAALYTIGIYDSTGAISPMTPSFNAWNAAENTAVRLPFVRTRKLSVRAVGMPHFLQKGLLKQTWFVKSSITPSASSPSILPASRPPLSTCPRRCTTTEPSTGCPNWPTLLKKRDAPPPTF